MASIFTMQKSDQYKTDSATDQELRAHIVSYLATIDKDSAISIVNAIDTVLPIVYSDIQTITKSLKVIGSIVFKRVKYADNIKQELKSLSFSNINLILKKGKIGAVGIDNTTTLDVNKLFNSVNLKLVGNYKFKQSLADFYGRYSAHLQDKKERFTNELRELIDVHDTLTMVRDTLSTKAGI